MKEDILTSGDGDTETRSQPQALKTILYSGLAVGVLDGLAATTSAWLRGVAPDRVFQYIASGLLGKEAFGGGIATVILGIFLHFVVAVGAAAVFVAASRFIPFLLLRPFITGLLYGIIVFFVMRDVVSPLSLVSRPASPTAATIITGMIIHIFFVGLPIVLITRYFARSEKELP